LGYFWRSLGGNFHTDTAGSSLRRLSSLQHGIYNLAEHRHVDERYSVASAGPWGRSSHPWTKIGWGDALFSHSRAFEEKPAGRKMRDRVKSLFHRRWVPRTPDPGACMAGLGRNGRRRVGRLSVETRVAAGRTASRRVASRPVGADNVVLVELVVLYTSMLSIHDYTWPSRAVRFYRRLSGGDAESRDIHRSRTATAGPVPA